jgi:hypothetical protein
MARGTSQRRRCAQLSPDGINQPAFSPRARMLRRRAPGRTPPLRVGAARIGESARGRRAGRHLKTLRRRVPAWCATARASERTGELRVQILLAQWKSEATENGASQCQESACDKTDDLREACAGCAIHTSRVRFSGRQDDGECCAISRFPLRRGVRYNHALDWISRSPLRPGT